MLVSVFRLGDIYLGINIVLIREINRSSDCTPVPGSQDYIRGLLNIRGRVITLFDLKRRTIESYFGYYGDSWVKLQLTDYVAS